MDPQPRRGALYWGVAAGAVVGLSLAAWWVWRRDGDAVTSAEGCARSDTAGGGAGGDKPMSPGAPSSPLDKRGEEEVEEEGMSLPMFVDEVDDPTECGLGSPVHVARALEEHEPPTPPEVVAAALKLMFTHSAHAPLLKVYVKLGLVERVVGLLPSLPLPAQGIALHVLANAVTDVDASAVLLSPAALSAVSSLIRARLTSAQTEVQVVQRVRHQAVIAGGGRFLANACMTAVGCRVVQGCDGIPLCMGMITTRHLRNDVALHAYKALTNLALEVETREAVRTGVAQCPAWTDALAQRISRGGGDAFAEQTAFFLKALNS